MEEFRLIVTRRGNEGETEFRAAGDGRKAGTRHPPRNP
jgi:hypothetical protein